MKPRKLVLSPMRLRRDYTPQDAVYDWSAGREFMCEDGLVSVADVQALSENYDRLVFTCGGGSTFLDLKPEDQPSFAFHSDGLFHTDECEAKRLAFKYGGRDEPLLRRE